MTNVPRRDPTPTSTGQPLTRLGSRPRDAGALAPILVAALAAELVYLVVVAVQLPVDYWDGYEYLMSARKIAGHVVDRPEFGYVWSRPPFVPLLLAPVMLGYRPAGGGTALWGPHLVAVALALLAVVALYGLLREGFGRTDALLGCLVLALNPLFFHCAPFVLADVPAMMLLTAAALAYVRACRGGVGRQLVAGIALGAAVVAKYSAVFLVPALPLFELVRALREGRPARLATALRPLVVLATAAAFVYLVHAALIARVMPWLRTVPHLLQIVAAQRALSPFAMSDPASEFAEELAVSFTFPLVAVAAIGTVAAARRRRDADLLCLAWFSVLFTLLTVLVAHKEARYVLPAVPPLVYLVIAGVHAIRSVLPPRIAAAVLLLIAVGPARLAVGEALRFRDPVYHEPVLPEAARWLLERSAPGQRVLATTDTGDVQFIYSMYPRTPRFFRWDEYYLFHHVGRYTLDYFLDRPAVREAAIDIGDLGALVDRFPHDEVVLASPGDFYDTNGYATVAEPPRPLTTMAIGRRTLRAVAEPGAGPLSYVAEGAPEARVVLVHDPEGWRISERALPDEWTVLARPSPGDAPVVLPLARNEPPAVLEAVRVERRQFTYR